jgi:hypothetical protein
MLQWHTWHSFINDNPGFMNSANNYYKILEGKDKA